MIFIIYVQPGRRLQCMMIVIHGLSTWAGNISGKECGNEKEFYSMADAFGCDHAFPAMVSRDTCKKGCRKTGRSKGGFR